MASPNFLQAFAPFASDYQEPAPMDILADRLANYEPQAQPSNVLQEIAKPVDVARGKMKAGAPGRGRRSLLDIIGRIGDAIAVAGDGDPIYQMGLEHDQDRAREIDLEDLRAQSERQQLEMGGLQIEGARQDLAGSERERIGLALGGIIGSENPAEDWMTVAEQARIDPQRAAAIGQAIQRNPEIVEPLATSFGFGPQQGRGSQAKELQIYGLLAEQAGPEVANAYLQSLANPDSMSAYQQAQLALAMEKFGFEQYKFENPQPTAAERTATAAAAGEQAQQQELASSGQNILNELRDAYGRLRDAGGISASGQNMEQRAGATILQNVPGVERMLQPEGFSAREDINRLRTVGIPSLLPLMGGLTLGGRNMDAAKELETWQRAIASASDYESAMRAIDMIEGRIRAIQARPAPAAPAPRRTSSSAPAPRQTHDRAALDNTATVERGWRYTPGPGGRANRANWTRAN